MSEFKKMVLVPQDLGSHMQASVHANQSYQSELDNAMKSVLYQTNINDYEKWKLYQQTLQRYLHYSNQLRQPVSLPIISEEKETASSETFHKQSLPLLHEIVESVSKTFRKRAQLLLDRLQSCPKISWIVMVLLLCLEKKF